MKRIILPILLICLLNVSFGQTEQTVDLGAGERGSSVQLIAAAPRSIELGQKLTIQVALTNVGHELVYFSYLNPYTDFEIRVFDQNGKPCSLTEFGMRELVSGMPGFTSPVRDTNQVVRIRSGSSISGVLRPADDEQNTTRTQRSLSSYTWNIDLSRCYQLGSGRYRIDLTYIKERSLQGLKANSIFFDVKAGSAGTERR